MLVSLGNVDVLLEYGHCEGCYQDLRGDVKAEANLSPQLKGALSCWEARRREQVTTFILREKIIVVSLLDADLLDYAVEHVTFDLRSQTGQVILIGHLSVARNRLRHNADAQVRRPRQIAPTNLAALSTTS